MDSVFTPTGTEAGSDPGAAGAAPARHWEGTLQTLQTHRHPDDSTSRAVWFDGLSVWTGEAPPSGPASAAALAGLVVDLRTFDDHEILAIDHLEHWVGAPRLGDTLLPLWPALSPEIPDLDPGIPQRRRSNLPILLEDGTGVILTLELTWTLQEQAVPEGLPPAWRVRCEGSVRGDGRDRAGDWRARDRFEGSVAADLWVAQADHEVVLGEFDWDLTVSTRVAAATDAALRGDLAQRQHHRGSLRRLETPTTPLPSWATPSPRPYRTPPDVHQVFESAGPVLTDCMALASPPPAPWAAHLAVSLDPEGRVINTEISTDTPWAGGEHCVHATACGLAFPPDAEPDARWGYTVAWAQGAVQPYPRVEPPAPARGPLFVTLPEEPTPAQRDQLELLYGSPAHPAPTASAPLPCR